MDARPARSTSAFRSGATPGSVVVAGMGQLARAACRLEWCQLQIAARCCCGGVGVGCSSGTIDGVAVVSYNDRCLHVCASGDLATCIASHCRSLSPCPAEQFLYDKTSRFLHAITRATVVVMSISVKLLVMCVQLWFYTEH